MLTSTCTVVILFRLGSLLSGAKCANSKGPTISDPKFTPQRCTLEFCTEQMATVREGENQQLLAVSPWKISNSSSISQRM